MLPLTSTVTVLSDPVQAKNPHPESACSNYEQKLQIRWSETSKGGEEDAVVDDDDGDDDADIRDEDDIDSANICITKETEPINHKTKQ